MSWWRMTGKHVEVIPQGAMPWRCWLGHFLTSRKVAVSISDSVTGNFHWHNPSGLTMTLGSTQSLREMITRQPVPRDDNLTDFMFPLSWNLGVSIIIQHLVSSHCVGGRPVYRLREKSLNLYTGRPPTECNNTRCCIIQFWPPDDEHMCSKHVEAYNKLIIKQDFVHQVG